MRFLLAFFVFVTFIYAENTEEFTKNLEGVYSVKEKLHIINNELKDNITIKNYKNYQEYLRLKNELKEANENLLKAKKTQKEQLENTIKSLEDKLSVLKDYESYSVVKYLNLPSEPTEYKKISNIYLVIEGLSERKELANEKKEYEIKLKDFTTLVSKIDKKTKLLQELYDIEPSENLSQELVYSIKELNDYKSALENITNAFEIFKVKANNTIKLINNDIKKQYDSAIFFIAIIICIFIARYLLGLMLRKYVDDKDKVYTSFKILNIFTFIIVSMFSIFYFVENISYLVSVLGFASAGLAIAMKDMFMSLLGWATLQFGGGFHVGDRVKVSKNGVTYVGDIIDISLLKMTIYEDVTYTTFLTNRRAGRIIYIPNHYIFTELISNYNYSYMKTVWDGIDIVIDFSSNLEKAKQIILESASSHTQAFSDSAKKAIQKMRNHYQMKNSGTDPKLFVMLEQYGIKISIWYMTNSREALKMRSIVSEEIIKRLKASDDIKLAFPSQTIYMDKRNNQPFLKDNNENIY
ncbi:MULTISPECIES: mechanosensitive ion channel domain-containing protein [unclassified Campylobacter]|uniref:mechanosensitive ion channel domain-containing protein n=2 Tax=Campylobacter TaxID=194 RepID=UPI001BD9D16D|nr:MULTISPECIES: mechanosensitive ion channel domain-containing protein [unclassified Campylobacter]MBZ7978462.1 mechanosensitive ion channel [Campylobacter sp. RM12654]MBZ7980257.1 mechanosensitive ion channel [Campylobacter sp. RM12642]MBZ7982322.1 mechanosensitive ion channel [Campylobacter sp. RM12640]MBZ7984203.1 mechanosensitive ion channel [Campylobacter sp. RM12647]MBZ7989524.1 mechanosensitive ion channel [Campylobacter sp. RM12635]MBZ7991795.1 mechanosensitive ion channel [Campyloba